MFTLVFSCIEVEYNLHKSIPRANFLEMLLLPYFILFLWLQITDS